MNWSLLTADRTTYAKIVAGSSQRSSSLSALYMSNSTEVSDLERRARGERLALGGLYAWKKKACDEWWPRG
jgi:hypothetical protein